MADLSFSDILAMQRVLQAAHEGEWTKLMPSTGRDSLLWMVEELGEAAAVIKKKGDGAIMDNPTVRNGFVEELCDVLMYFGDVMLCYGITPGELGDAFRTKHNYNMRRDYRGQNEALLSD